MESTRPIRALVRGLEALTVLNLRDGATVSEIAHDIGLPRTTVYRILQTLCDSGFVYRDAADERYRLTILVRGLSSGFADEAWLTMTASPLLLQLADDIVWPMHLSSADGMRLTVRAVTDHRSAPLAPSAAARGSTCRSPTVPQAGPILHFVRRYSGMPWSRRWRAALRARARPFSRGRNCGRWLVEIRQQGYGCLVRGQRFAEELNLSVPIVAEDRPLAILTVRFRTSDLPAKAGIERFLPKLRHCAAKISNKFSAQQAGVRSSGAPRTGSLRSQNEEDHGFA